MLPPKKNLTPLASRVAQEKKADANIPTGNIYRAILFIEHDLRQAKKALIRADLASAKEKLLQIQQTINTINE